EGGLLLVWLSLASRASSSRTRACSRAICSRCWAVSASSSAIRASGGMPLYYLTLQVCLTYYACCLESEHGQELVPSGVVPACVAPGLAAGSVVFIAAVAVRLWLRSAAQVTRVHGLDVEHLVLAYQYVTVQADSE